MERDLTAVPALSPTSKWLQAAPYGFWRVQIVLVQRHHRGILGRLLGEVANEGEVASGDRVHDKEIAQHTELSLSSMRTYAQRIYRRLGITGRSELFAMALAEKGFLPCGS